MFFSFWQAPPNNHEAMEVESVEPKLSSPGAHLQIQMEVQFLYVRWVCSTLGYEDFTVWGYSRGFLWTTVIVGL